MYEKEWYKNIPKNGILCWVWDEDDDKKSIAVVTNYACDAKNYMFETCSEAFQYAEPLTKEEIEKYFMTS